MNARSRRRPGGGSRWRFWLPWLLAGPTACIGGCAGVPPGEAVSGPEAVHATPESARPPRWQSVERSPAAARRASGGVLFDDPQAAPVPFSQDPDLLRAEVAAECLAARALGQPDPLARVVSSLHLSEVDPGEGTEALIRGECGPVAEVVRAMVATGGEIVMQPVVERARLLSPPAATGTIEAAAADGLKRHVAAAGPGTAPSRATARPAMAYYPSAGQGVRIDTADALDRLYRQAVPGYGIYTFVLVGPGLGRPGDADLARHRELFRLVETYAAVGDAAAGDPQPHVHTFVIPVDAERAEESLFGQVAADLSDQMRARLVGDLRLQGRSTLADRLENGAGPFLVAGFEPDLLPGRLDAARLVADLSGIGVEHLYPIVDAFDRSVPSQLSGRAESLLAVRDRLEAVVPARAGDQESAAAAMAQWVFMLGTGGEPGAAVAGRRRASAPMLLARTDRSGI